MYVWQCNYLNICIYLYSIYTYMYIYVYIHKFIHNYICMCVYVYLYTYIHIYMAMYVCLQTFIHICINTCIHTYNTYNHTYNRYNHPYICGYIHTSVCLICVFMSIQTEMCTHACLPTHTYIYACMYVIHLYIHICIPI